MINKEIEEQNQQIIQALFHVENEVVLNAVKKIHNSGNVELLYPLLQLIKRTSNPKVERKSKAVFFDLKTNDATAFVVESIKAEDDISIKQFLVTACWNNSLDYSAHLDLFIDLFLNEIFEIAFDAYTVIENMIGFPDLEIIKIQIDKLKSKASTIESSKKQLLVDLVNLLEG